MEVIGCEIPSSLQFVFQVVVIVEAIRCNVGEKSKLEADDHERDFIDEMLSSNLPVPPLVCFCQEEQHNECRYHKNTYPYSRRVVHKDETCCIKDSSQDIDQYMDHVAILTLVEFKAKEKCSIPPVAGILLFSHIHKELTIDFNV